MYRKSILIVIALLGLLVMLPAAIVSAQSAPALPTGLAHDYPTADSRGYLTYTWDHDTNAQYYHLIVTLANGTTKLDQWYDVDGLNAAGIAAQLPPVYCSTTCSVQPDNIIVSNGSYRWYVQSWGSGGWNANNQNGWSEGPAFTVSETAPNAANFALANFVALNNETLDNKDTPSFNWNGIDGASWYEITISGTGGTTIFQEWRNRLDLRCNDIDGSNATPCSVDSYPNEPTGSLLLTNGNYFWRVRAWGPGGMSGYSSWAQFTIDAGTSIANDRPERRSPGDGETVMTNRPDFVWGEVIGGTWYNVIIIHNSLGTVINEWLHYNHRCNIRFGECTWRGTSLPINLPNGGYTWWIRGWGPGGFSQWSGYDPQTGQFAQQTFIVSP